MLELYNIKRYFKDNRAVDGISFRLERGEVLGLIGANGAGKTTTLSMIATLIKPDSGTIYYEGQDVAKNPGVLRNNLGYVPQEVALYPNLSGEDNLRFWGRANEIRGKKLKQRIHEVSKILDLSENVLNKKVSTYSGGIKRRLNIGVALLHEPAIIIMDEPTVGLDVESRQQILSMVTELKKRGAGIIYAGHYMEELEKICDKLCVIDKGKCVLFGQKEELLKGKQSLEQLYLDIVNK